MKRAPCWQKSAALNNSVGARCGLGPAYRGFGFGAQVQGEHQQAVVMFRRSLDTFTELGGGWWLARLPAEMSRSVFARGNDNEARRVWREALHIATDIHRTSLALEALFGLSSLQAKHCDREYALELLLMVLNHPASFQETKNRAAHLRAEVEAHLTSWQVEAAQMRVQTKILESAVDEVLKQV